MLIAWARGGQLGRRGQGYQAILEFPVACGITVGGRMGGCFWAQPHASLLCRHSCLVAAVLPPARGAVLAVSLGTR